MIKKALFFSILIGCFSYAFAQDSVEKDIEDNTASPVIQKDKKEISQDEEKASKDFVLTAPQLPSLITTAEEEKDKQKK